MQSTCFSGYRGLRLAADIGGDPSHRPVILMHGGGQTRYSWGKAAAELVGAGYHVISLDLRGHGESAWAADGDYSTDAFVCDIKAVAATLAAPPALVGASLGGASSLVAVGESVAPLASALILVDVVPRMEKQGIDRIRGFMLGNPEGFCSLEEAADTVAAYMPHRPRPANNDGLMKNLRAGDNGRLFWHWDPAFHGSDDSRRTSDLFARMDAAARRVTVPTLIVRGKISEVVSAAGARHLNEMIPHAVTADVEGAGHMVAGDRNDAFNASVKEFLRSHMPVTVA